MAPQHSSQLQHREKPWPAPAVTFKFKVKFAECIKHTNGWAQFYPRRGSKSLLGFIFPETKKEKKKHAQIIWMCPVPSSPSSKTPPGTDGWTTSWSLSSQSLVIGAAAALPSARTHRLASSIHYRTHRQQIGRCSYNTDFARMVGWKVEA